jgi:CRP/FNR family transcriptional regulator, cyclic AMP receptor protein
LKLLSVYRQIGREPVWSSDEVGSQVEDMAFPHLSQPVAQGIRILDADPDLAQDLPPGRFEQAHHALVARTERIPTGNYSANLGTADHGAGIGLLVIDGVALRRMALGHRSAAELLGAGDILRPAQDGDPEMAAPFTPSFRVIEPLLVAILDERFGVRLARFPELVPTIVARTMERSRTLSRMLAVAQLPRVDTRLLVAMWHLSERWGTVRPEGRVLPGFLSHELLGWIVGARRPSVTTALGELAQRELIRRQPDGTWLLMGQAPAMDRINVAQAA